MPAFDRTKIPKEVFQPKSLDHLDDLVDRMRALRSQEIVVSDTHNSFRLPGMARALSQSYIWRCVELAESTAILCHLGHWLSAIINARSILETIATYNHIVSGLRTKVDDRDIQAIHDFLHAAAFQTRVPSLIGLASDPNVKSVNILTQIEKLEKKYKKPFLEDYDYLSDFSHPNSLGTFLFFGKHNKKTDVVSFSGEGWVADEVFKWIGCTFSMFDAAIFAAKEIEKLAQRISEMEDST